MYKEQKTIETLDKQTSRNKTQEFIIQDYT